MNDHDLTHTLLEQRTRGMAQSDGVQTPVLLTDGKPRRFASFDFVEDLEHCQTRVAACECHDETAPQVRPFRDNQQQHDEKEKEARNGRQ